MPGRLVITSARWCAAKSALDVGVGGFDAVIEGNHPLCQFGNQAGGDILTGQAHRLCLGGSNCGVGDRSSVAHPGISQDLRQPRNTAVANGFRALVSRKQHHPAAIGGQRSYSLQGRAHRHQLLTQPVDGAGAIRDQVRAVGGQHPQFGDQVIVGRQDRQIGPDASGIDRRSPGRLWRRSWPPRRDRPPRPATPPDPPGNAPAYRQQPDTVNNNAAYTVVRSTVQDTSSASWSISATRSRMGCSSLTSLRDNTTAPVSSTTHTQ